MGSVDRASCGPPSVKSVRPEGWPPHPLASNSLSALSPMGFYVDGDGSSVGSAEPDNDVWLINHNPQEVHPPPPSRRLPGPAGPHSQTSGWQGLWFGLRDVSPDRVEEQGVGLPRKGLTLDPMPVP